MRNCLRLLLASVLLLTASTALAQAPAPPLAFEVATVKPSAALDPAKMMAAMQSGKMPNFGPHVDAAHAEFNYMSLKDLIAFAYKVKPYQITGPGWLSSQRFDIAAKLPDGASKDDAPAMMQALLADRFKLTAHRDTQEHPVLALVVAKGGPKLKESTVTPEAVDDSAPLKPGEVKMDTPNGPARMTRNPDGTTTMNMGAKGTFTQKMDGQALRLEASSLTMGGFADMLTSMLQIGSAGGRHVIDSTGLKGNYEVAFEVPIADLLAAARAQGMAMPGGRPGAGGGESPGVLAASDPSGGSTIFDSVKALGLNLEQRKAPVEQIIVDHAEKAPTEN